MRIQHNIMSMNAYRNYTNNVSAMQKNLERLSSGYKINRAGDDAAGLAISEKMRAQITGLQTAQKNAKDGISLVQTAEGALTEVHDMLNRMVELATMSANGTYHNDTDRTQLQKEVDQLMEEIDRIAESANFNGIKLLNGDLDQGGRSVNIDGITILKEGGTLGDIGDLTLIHGSGSDAAITEFGVEFDNLSITPGADGGVLEVDIGGTKIQISLEAKQDGKAYTASELAEALKDAFDQSDKKIDGETFTTKIDGTRVIFTQDAGGSKHVSANMTVKMSYGDDVSSLEPLSGGTPVGQSGGTVVYSSSGPDIKITKGTDAGGFTGDNDPQDETPVTNAFSGAEFASDWETAKSSLTGTLTFGTGSSQVTIDLDEIVGLTDAEDANAAAALIQTYINQQFGIKSEELAEGTTSYTEYSSAVVTLNDTGISVAYKSEQMTYSASEPAAAPPKAEIDFAGLTGEDVIGQTLTIDGKVYEFVADEGDLSDDGNIAVVVNDADDDETIASALETAMATKGENVASATANGSVVTVTGNKDGAENTLTVEYSGGSPDPEESTPVNSEVIDGTGALSGIDFSSATDQAKKLSDLTQNEKAALTGLQDFQINGEVDVEIAAIASAWDDNTTIAKILADIAQAVSDAVEAWNEANAMEDNSPYHYEFVGLSSDGTNADIDLQLAGGGVTALVNKVNGPAEHDDPPTGDTVNGVSGNYNHGTVKITQGVDAGGTQYASTTIDLKDIFGSDIGDGSTLTIGADTYKFVYSDGYKAASGTTIYLDKNASAADRLLQAARGLTNMSNKDFTIGERTNGTEISVSEKNGGATTADVKEALNTYEGFKGLFKATSATTKDETKGLTLQIGDTADSYNQLQVSIYDCHVSAMGLAGINIENQDDAADAVDKIKDAINYVSDVRGTLGATQNRLDHTINNLSVMTENIQDAESTIRDTDVAEEMMAYTKNNILIQAAQAMLAQANQVPQGVLQLLQ